MSTKSWFRYENGVLVLLGLTFGFLFFDRNATGFLAPFIAPDLKLDNSEIGWISSGLSITWALSAYFFAAWSDRAGIRKPFLIACVLAFSACSFLSGIAGSFLVLLGFRLLMGLAEGPFLPVALAVMAAESSPERRGFNMGVLQNTFSALLGTFLAPVILMPIAEAYSWRVSFFVAGVPGLLCALLIWRYIREPAAPRREVVAAGDISMGLHEMLRVRNVWVCSLISCCMVGWMVLGWAFLPTFFISYRHIDPSNVKWLMGALGVCASYGGLVVPALSDRVGRRPVLIAVCFLAVLTPLASLYFQGSLVLLGLLMFVGWHAAGGFPLYMGTIPAESTSPRLIATAMGIVVGIGEIVGGFLLPPAAGWVADQSSLEAPILIQAGCALLGGVAALALVETAPARTGVRAK